MNIRILTVSDINNYIKRNFDNDVILQNCSIKGEISNIKFHSSGHIYFSLKDEFSKINCIMFKSSARNLNFNPENGMRVVVKGRISVYQKGGSYQLYCSEINLEGMGNLYEAFEKLKRELNQKGLFDEKHKKRIPPYPFKIGVVTSPTGAALRDIINVTRRRNKSVQLVLYPSLVQGAKASDNIVEGIHVLDSIEDIDLIILARGGGSIEDLWCFNEEKVALAIYNCNKPIVTGIGHEIDYTIADFAADRRAPTPSAAAEVAVFDLESQIQKIKSYETALSRNINFILDSKKDRFFYSMKRLNSNSPMIYIANQYVNVDRLKDMLIMKFNTKLDKNKEKLKRLKGLIEANSPFKILDKGYSIIENKSGNIVNSINELERESQIQVIMKDGKSKFNISKISEN
ncbi:exodeoxyribonuclease VII large subunit [Clostridium sp.]|jgi:exodeoxyribonuclease VII large subunit|uniref:exodeoxyribonuclease VII large subunit n=1 Tax=Clostridium sp. TaxID=1506 RepID=UPI003A5BEDCB